MDAGKIEADPRRYQPFVSLNRCDGRSTRGVLVNEPSTEYLRIGEMESLFVRRIEAAAAMRLLRGLS
jgi:hypothetical protein